MTVPGNLSSPLLATAAADAAAADAIITKSLRFNKADTAYCNKTFSSAGTTGTTTFSAWVKRAALGVQQSLISVIESGNYAAIQFNDDDNLTFNPYSSSYGIATSNAAFRDPGAWYHVVVTVDVSNSTSADRLRLYVNGARLSTASYTAPTAGILTKALEHRIGLSSSTGHPLGAYLTDVYLIDGQALEPTSFGAYDSNGVWQAAAYSGTFGTNGFHLFDFENITGSGFGGSWLGNDTSGNNNNFTANNIIPYGGTGSYTSGISYGNRTLTTYDKDDVVDGDLTNGYIDRPINNNGLSFSSIPQASTSVRIHCAVESGTMSTNAGTLTTATGSDVGVWKTVDTTYPFTLTSITVTGGSSADGFYIYGIEVDGVVLVDTTSQNATEGDLVYDVPVNGSQSDTGRGGELSSNYSTMNPLAKNSNTTLSNGNLDVSSTAVYTTLSTIAFPSTGKFYAEFRINGTASGYPFVGIGGFNDTAIYSNANPNTGAFYAQGGYVTGSVSVTGLTALNAGDIVGVAYDTSNGKVWFSLNGTYVNSGDPANGTNATCTLSANASGYALATSTYQSGTVTLNAGQKAFNTNAPSGFKCLCTSNLPTPTISDGSDYFNAITYTGDGVNDRTITTTLTTVGAAWLKRRDVSDNHRLATVVQGGNAWLSPNLNGAENNATSIVRAFSGNTFDIGTDTSVNASSGSHIAWAWDAGTSNASNTDGTITSTVRANTTAGFSVVTYTGNGTYNSQIGHGLGVSPHLLIVKSRSASSDWAVYTRGTGAQKYLLLNSTAAEATDSSYWAYNTPEASVFRVGTNADVNANGTTYIAYCFAPVAGYSAFGEYAGNSSSDGPFISTNFRPAWVMVKAYDGSRDWMIFDSARGAFNVNDKSLVANTSGAELSPGYKMDFLSNGFKLRASAMETNNSALNYIYIAFAENPFQANGGLAR